MSRTTWNLDRDALRGLYRDRENGWLFGVCAGIADRVGISIIPVRVVAALSLILFTVPTLLVYGAAILLFREKPLIYAGRRNEHEFWRCRQDGSGSRP